MSITGVMVESFLNEGRQDIPASGPKDLKHGVSMSVLPSPLLLELKMHNRTDACVHWDDTLSMMDELNKAVGDRRKAKQ